MFGIGYVNKPIEICSLEKFNAAIDSPLTKDAAYLIQRMVKAKEQTSEASKIKWCDERISATKRALPCITPMAWFKDNKRSIKNAVPSGLNMIDIDHIDDPVGLWDSVKDKVNEALKVVLVHKTPSTRGLRIVFVNPEGKSIEGAQQELAALIGTDYDTCTKDLARCSFLVPREYFLVINEEALFADYVAPSEAVAKVASLVAEGKDIDAAPVKTETKKETSVTFKKDFKGIPYEEIIRSILFAGGYDNVPSEGERNMALYMLARNLRYLCDFNTDYIISVLPDWGLPSSEVRNTVESAVKSVRRVSMPVTLQSTVDTLFKQYNSMSEQGYDAIFDYVVEPTGLIGDIVKTQPLAVRNAAYIATMACLATLLTRLRGKDVGGDEVRPNFMVCIDAPQATGKSFMKKIYELVTDPIFKHDEEMRKQLREIRKKNENNKNKENYEKQEFDGDIRLLPTNTSNRILIERLTLAKKQHLMIMAEEIDSITKAEKTGKWSEKSDIYRLAFDNSKWGMDYANDNAFTATVEIYLNLLFSGTPVSVRRFFNDIENGLVTRFLFCNLPDNLGLTRPEAVNADADVIKSIKERLQGIYDTMSQCKGEGAEIWMETEKLNKDIMELYETPQRMQFLCNQTDLCRGIVYRRYSKYATAIGMIEIWLNDGVYTEDIRDRVIGITNYCTETLIANYGDELNASLAVARERDVKVKIRSQRLNTLDSVGDSFTAHDYEKALTDAGIQASHASCYLARLVNGGLIEKVARGSYKKIKH